MSTPPRSPHLVRTHELDPATALHVSHPFNERSELFMQRLSDPAGLSHLGVSLARVPPGKESFALHRHTIQEEWIYVVSGRGHVRLDDQELPVEPGDFLGFPASGPAHLVRNTSTDEDLVYLQGGDRRTGDRGHFPELGKVSYQHDEGHMAFVDEDQVQVLPYTRWLAKGS
ncbi:MAG: cupin domain-containing protein [Myxococcales bacterium]|nr:cupin domain-containing protein [Myxococcales bacterium]